VGAKKTSPRSESRGRKNPEGTEILKSSFIGKNYTLTFEKGQAFPDARGRFSRKNSNKGVFLENNAAEGRACAK